jgi:hypothetical protein
LNRVDWPPRGRQYHHMLVTVTGGTEGLSVGNRITCGPIALKLVDCDVDAFMPRALFGVVWVDANAEPVVDECARELARRARVEEWRS